MKKLLLAVSLWATAAALTLVGAQDAKPLNLAPYFPTPTMVVKAMLELGELKPGEPGFCNKKARAPSKP